MISCQSPSWNEFAVVGTAPELAADSGRVAQVFDGFKKRHRHQPGISAVAFACALHVTPPSRARRITASTSSTDDAPLITYWRTASGEQPCLTSATARKVSSTLAVCAESRGQRGAMVSLIASCNAAA